MKKYFEDFKNLIKTPLFSVPVFAAALLSFAWQLTRFNIGIDDVVRKRYFTGGLFAQGRFSGPVLSTLSGFVKPFPFFEPFFGVLLLIAASFSLAILLRRASKDGLPVPVLSFFASLFVSYPLIAEIFVYKGSDFYTGVGFFLSAVSLLVMDGVFSDRTTDGGNKKRFGPAGGVVVTAAIQFFLVSLYESFAAVYLVLAGIYFFTCVYFRKTPVNTGACEKAENREKPCRLRDLLLLALPLVAGVVLEYLFGLAVNAIFDFGIPNYAANNIAIPENFSLGYVKDVLYLLFRRFFLAGGWYLPIAFFAAAFLISVPVFIVCAVKKKSLAVVFAALGVYAGLFGIGLLVGGSVKYRTCVSLAPFTAFFIAFLFHVLTRSLKKNAGKIVAAVLAAVLVLSQCAAMNYAFDSNDLRWREEKTVLTACAETLTKGGYDVENKPVIFIGEYRLSDEVLARKYVRSGDPLYVFVKKAANKAGFNLATTDLDDTFVLETCMAGFGSVITWGVFDAYSCNEGLLLVFDQLGYRFIQGTAERYEELSKEEEKYPVFNETGEITELEDVIVVRFG